jgi:pSer/pThr/pTyr-binding forkhead associated (FHA) protein
VSTTAATVEDLGSKNGTFLNGVELDHPKPLESGDEIRIGRDVARYRFLIEGDVTVTERS